MEGRPLSPPAAVGCGLLMGGADAIPGVSGGTIALVLGIYERFLEALSCVIRAPWHLRDPEGRRELGRALGFLVPLGLGVAVAYYAVTSVLIGDADRTDSLMKAPDTAALCYGFFFGLVLLSVREPWTRLAHRGPFIWVGVAVGFSAAFLFSGLPYARTEPQTWMLLLGGAGAISIMLLPGVSGSLFLVMIGQYHAVVEALHGRDVLRFGVFLLGIALGFALFVPLLRRLLRVAHDTTMAVLTGLMAGSLRALWPWKEQYDPKAGPTINQAPGDDLPLVIVAVLCGMAVVLLLRRIERRLEGAPRQP